MKETNELINTITAATGMLLAYIGFIALIVVSNSYDDTWKLVCSVVYGITLILLHTASTIHHGMLLISKPEKKYLVLDLSCIYALIAGTYTPIVLVQLYNPLGITIAATIWALAITGISINMANYERFKGLNLPLYLFMGWFALIGFKELIAVMDPNGIILIVIGGLFFTVGTFFLTRKNSRYAHGVWHILVLLGCASHYFSIMNYVLPFGT